MLEPTVVRFLSHLVRDQERSAAFSLQSVGGHGTLPNASSSAWTSSKPTWTVRP